MAELVTVTIDERTVQVAKGTGMVETAQAGCQQVANPARQQPALLRIHAVAGFPVVERQRDQVLYNEKGQTFRFVV